ncbi:MAG: sigma-E factor negative regulatory protein [Gammaproteobacteria bacterium]|nr:sigma-E factor negative regulatory protein [Gammaproteobacteria bacterium]
MKDKIGEQISALFDGELEQQEHELLMRRLKQDTGLQGDFARYQIISDAMRDKLDTVTTDLVQKVSGSIEHEDSISSQGSASKSVRLLKPVAGFAIAASVAAMAVIGLQGVGNIQEAPQISPRLAQVQPHTGILRVSTGTRWDRQQPETERRLNGYLVNHSEYTSSISLQGMINYARIAGYDSKKPHKK